MAALTGTDTMSVMSGPQYGVPPGESWQSLSPNQLAQRTKNSIFISLIAIVLALGAIAFAVASWFRPSAGEAPHPAHDTPAFSAEDATQATKTMCEAYEKAVDAVLGASGSQQEPDPVRSFVMTVDARFAFHVSAEYFRSELARNPATPPVLAAEFQDLAAIYDELLLAQLARKPDSDLQPLYDRSEAADAKIVSACRTYR